MVRRIGMAGCLAVLAGVALAGCTMRSATPHVAGPAPATPTATSTGRASTAPSASASATPDISAGASVAPAPDRSGSTPAASQMCYASELRLAQLPGDNGASGTIIVRIQLTNTGGRTCTLRGYPVFTLTAHSASMGRDIDEPVTLVHGNLGPLAAPVTTVDLAPGGRAGFFLAYSNRKANGDGGCEDASTMHLTPPDRSATVAGPVDILVCVSTLQLSPFVPAAQLD